MDNQFEANSFEMNSDVQERLATFLKSDIWESICTDANHCESSVALMEELSVRVASLVFFIENEISDRVTREENELLNLINTYEN